tara:strand:+ start:572 stop:1207 length:636 start_codon:yes stop_codon:yes gene_type:complete
MRIIIPARLGSKGVPFKNRKLLSLTMETIPEKLRLKTIVSTNDPEIVRAVDEQYVGCAIHHRSEESCRDESSMKDCAVEVVEDLQIGHEDVAILYLTYPERTWAQVESAYNWFRENSGKSLLCRQETQSHPFLCFYELPNGRGSPLVRHDLHRRQDYPSCFHVRHMISIFKGHELENLNENLYNDDTLFYEIDKTLDVDTEEDIKLARRTK